jgi:hypothetical protein
MDIGLATVFAAAIATLGGIVVTIMQLKQVRNENRADHQVVQKRLDNLIDMVGKQGAKLTSHLDWHLTKEPSKDLSKVKQVATRKKK